MADLGTRSLRHYVGALIVMLGIIVAGTWATTKITTDHFLNENATWAARDWAGFVAANVGDLEQIAAGEQPSAASMAFFRATRKAGQIFRYIIFNPEGYSQLVADRDKIALVDLSEYSPAAARAIATGTPVVDVKKSTSPDLPANFAEAYVPALVDGKPVAVVAAYLDQTEQLQYVRADFLLAAAALCLFTALSFGIPAIAWYRRTREKQEADRRIRFLAHHDALTGLANRARLTERLESALAILPSTGGLLALHFVDLDHFKEINDTLGHDGGDFFLKAIGERLTTMTRREDFVARLGGDEFVVVQTGLAHKGQAEDFARRVNSILTTPMFFKEQEIQPCLTIGVALAPDDGATPERLLKCADLALYAGKQAGRNCIRFFVPEMDEAQQARLRLERILRDAVAHNKLVLHYQPMLEMKDKQLIGFEALVRLPDPDGGLIPPATFIPLAEEMKLIDKVGEWVLREACRAAMTWPKNLIVAVNLSAAEFEAGTIVDIVAAALKDSGLEPHRLELEITEALLLVNTERTMAQLHKLKALGVSIVMDDFGTGYSSLSYLWKFPFDKIKIDRSFMEGFEGPGRDVETVVRTIIALGRELSMRVTVEGVENVNQVDFLYDADADQVQGFYFGRPVPGSEIAPTLLKGLQEEIAQRTKELAQRAKLKAAS